MSIAIPAIQPSGQHGERPSNEKVITQKPETVFELFQSHRERWTTLVAARDSDGDHCSPLSERAVCWCLTGAISYIYGPTAAARAAGERLLRYLEKTHRGMMSGILPGVAQFNDHLECTFEMVLEAAKEAQI